MIALTVMDSVNLHRFPCCWLYYSVQVCLVNYSCLVWELKVLCSLWVCLVLRLHFLNVAVLHCVWIYPCWIKVVMAKWSVLNQWSFKPNCIGKRFITRSFLKLFMRWSSSGLKNEQRLPKCCDSLQLLHLVPQLIPCFNLLYTNNGHCCVLPLK